VVAGVVAATGKAVAVDGGYRVTGRWSFGSGIHHSTSVVSGCVVFDGDEPRTMGANLPFVRMMLVPVSDCEIQDVWRVSGLRGTGSEDYTITDVFVPEERSFLPFFQKPHFDGPLYRLPITFFAVSLPCVALGIARAAIDEFLDLAKTKAPARIGQRTGLIDKPRMQLAVAQAEALAGSARAYLFEAVQEMWERVNAGDDVSMEQRAKTRIATCNAAVASAQAVDLMYNAGGGTSIYNRSILQRCLRDVHAATQHAGVNLDNMEDAGRVLFGLQPNAPVF
jgi:alkylation response protein AidB-like acyl-CoA dehydrogenase